MPSTTRLAQPWRDWIQYPWIRQRHWIASHNESLIAEAQFTFDFKHRISQRYQEKKVWSKQCAWWENWNTAYRSGNFHSKKNTWLKVCYKFTFSRFLKDSLKACREYNQSTFWFSFQQPTYKQDQKAEGLHLTSPSTVGHLHRFQLLHCQLNGDGCETCK